MKELGAWVWGKQIKGREIRSGKGARYKNFGWKDRAFHLRELEPRGDKTVVFFQPYSCLRLPSPHPGSRHSFLLSPFYISVFLGVCVVCTVCCVEVRGQPVEWELVLTFHHVDPLGRTQEVKLGSKHLL